MFGTNEIVGKSKFRDLDNKLIVTSIFPTIQGEGPYQGQPAIFVRLAYCNLNCSFCDTFFDQGDEFKIVDLIRKIDDVASECLGVFYADKAGIVITGGEPSLQQANLIPFLQACDNIGFQFIQIESNGILPWDSIQTYQTDLVVSPKFNENTKKYFKPHEVSLNKAKCLKFVVSADEDSPYHTIPDWAFEWREEIAGDIYISPMNMYKPEALLAARDRITERKKHSIEHRSTIDEVVSAWDDSVLDREKNRINHNYAYQYALKHGLRLTLQMHLFCAAP